MTIKYGKGYEETWAGFKGSPADVRATIIEFFDMDPESVAGLSLSSVVVNATNLAHAKGNIASKLGGTVISRGKAADSGPPWNTDDSASKPGGVWDQAVDTKPAEPEVNPILEQIENAKDVGALQRMWAENQAAFADAEVMTAWKAKGKSFKK